MELLSHYICRVFLYSFPIIAIALPFFLIALWQTPTAERRIVLIVIALIIVDEASLFAPRLPFFTALHWNWQGKILEIIWAIGFVIFYRSLNISEFGLTHKLNQNSVRPIIFIILLATLIPVGFFILGGRETADVETLLFQMTMPGIAEEIVFRGLFQGLLNRAFPKRWKIAKAQLGWGFVLTAIIFGVVHLVSVDKQNSIHLSIGNAMAPLIGGFILGWIRERGGSLLPCIIAHNLGNTLVVIGSYIWP